MVSWCATANCIVIEVEIILFVLEVEGLLGLERQWLLLHNHTPFHNVVRTWCIQIYGSKLAAHFGMTLVWLTSSSKLLERELHSRRVSPKWAACLVILQRSDENLQPRHKYSVVEFDDVLFGTATIDIPDELLVHGLVVLVGLLVLHLQIGEFDVELVGLADSIECA